MATCLLAVPMLTHAESLTIAAASDLKFALDAAVKQYQKNNAGDEITVIYGSSGKIFTQIQQAAPYDLYFSADINYPRQLVSEGFTSGDVIPYAIGRIVLWAPKDKVDVSKMTLQDLTAPQFKHIAIANPKHAPYGKRAEEALKAAGVWAQIESRLVFGENISQTAQFIQTQNAQIGIIALSLALSAELKKQGRYQLIPDTLHHPLEQGFVITKRAAGNALAHKFSRYMRSPEARKIMVEYGFTLPNEQLR